MAAYIFFLSLIFQDTLLLVNYIARNIPTYNVIGYLVSKFIFILRIHKCFDTKQKEILAYLYVIKYGTVDAYA